jgi:pyrimidine-nucleoside phosphorylase
VAERPYDLIKRKRDGGKLRDGEIAGFIAGYMDGSGAAEYQMSAFLMAVYFQGLDAEEMLALTRAYVESGQSLDLSGLEATVDKHSTGGVGDKTTLVLGPLLAAAGARMAKISGRGLGHTGGTVDKFESFPGFRTELPADAFIDQVREIGLAIIGQTREFVPADARVYALRDVTATVESIPLIAASVMSKKLAAGAQSIVLDVKTGGGAFMKSPQRAAELARAMVEIGRLAGRRTSALVTDMDQPLGRAVGNALEVKEALATLRGEGPEDLLALCLELGSELLVLAGLAGSDAEARERLLRTVADGSALDRFRRMVVAQGGDGAMVDDPERLPAAPVREAVRARRSGYIVGIDAEAVGRAAMVLGAGRVRKGDLIDHATGIMLGVRIGDKVMAGDELAVLHARLPLAAVATEDAVMESFCIGDAPPPRRPLVIERVK